MNLPELSSISWKVAIVQYFWHLPPQYWLFPKSAQWDDSNEYKNLYVGPNKCYFMTPGSFSQFLKIEIFSILDWLNLQNFTIICDLGRFWEQWKVNMVRETYILEFGIKITQFWTKIIEVTQLTWIEPALRFF